MASLAVSFGDQPGFVGGPDIIGGGSPAGDVELTVSPGGVQVSGALAAGAMPYDPSNPNFGSLRINSPQPITGFGVGASGNMGGLLIVLLILWAVFS